jgi:hypothetical protein
MESGSLFSFFFSAAKAPEAPIDKRKLPRVRVLSVERNE